MHYDVLIVGGGFAGAYCGRTLGKLLRQNAGKRVGLIAERNVLVFHPMLPEVVGSTLSPRDVVHPLREFCREIVVLQGNVTAVDWARRQVVVDGGRFTRNHTITFEHLVLAPGSVTDLSRVPGMSAYGWPLKTVADALRLRAAIVNRLEEANLTDDPGVRKRLLTFVVVGGGFTGVETAGQIVDLLHGAVRLYTNLLGEKPRVVLVHANSVLLPEIGEKLGRYAHRVLEEKGAEVLLNRRVSEVTAGKVILDDRTFIEAHTIVASIGSAMSPIVASLVEQLGLSTERGRVKVDKFLRAEGQTHLWAVGDCAAVPWLDSGSPKLAPPTAQFAVREGKQAGKNLVAVLAGRENKMESFTYRYLGQLATVGDRQAVAEVMGMHFKGFFAWWLWRTIYLAKLPGALRRLRVMIDWTLELFFPRDISITLPPPDDVIRSIHLETGELLVQAGEIARAFYVVRSGSIRSNESTPVQEMIGANGVIDDAYLDPQRRWRCTLVADAPSDVMVLRSRAFELLSSGLRLSARTAAGTAEVNPT
ncbi:FAD-dependent oxidoreductase [Nibricoccus sp. IMCC34717]|uniref:FAD-dependent oxidoreductase n=1 Tax=Nibricoccus sp. IMCC34717 TaxID=3034021 RepID=UPI00384F3247